MKQPCSCLVYRSVCVGTITGFCDEVAPLDSAHCPACGERSITIWHPVDDCRRCAGEGYIIGPDTPTKGKLLARVEDCPQVIFDRPPSYENEWWVKNTPVTVEVYERKADG